MDVPANAFTLAAFVALVLPGLVYSLVRTTMRGFRADDKSLDARIAQALTFSVILDALYLLALHPILPIVLAVNATTIELRNPGAVAIMVVILFAAIPAAISFIAQRGLVVAKDSSGRRRLVLSTLTYRSTPTAWDWSATRVGPRLVRVQLEDGRWVGGIFSRGSYASTYPEPRDLFIRHQWRMNEYGGFEEAIAQSSGVWISVGDSCIVEWIDPPPSAPSVGDRRDRTSP